MKDIPRHSKSIEIEFINMVTKDVCFRLTMPLSTQRQNCISKFYKRLKPQIANAERVEVSRISAKHKVIDAEKIDRILFEWRGGVALDMPDDASAYEYEIVLAQLNVIKMGRNH